MSKQTAINEATEYEYSGLRGDDERELWQTLLDTEAYTVLGGRFPSTVERLVETGVIETRGH